MIKLMIMSMQCACVSCRQQRCWLATLAIAACGRSATTYITWIAMNCYHWRRHLEMIVNHHLVLWLRSNVFQHLTSGRPLLLHHQPPPPERALEAGQSRRGRSSRERSSRRASGGPSLRRAAGGNPLLDRRSAPKGSLGRRSPAPASLGRLSPPPPGRHRSPPPEAGASATHQQDDRGRECS